MEALRKRLLTEHATVSQAKTLLHASAQAHKDRLWRPVQSSRPSYQSSTAPSVALPAWLISVAYPAMLTWRT